MNYRNPYQSNNEFRSKEEERQYQMAISNHFGQRSLQRHQTDLPPHSTQDQETNNDDVTKARQSLRLLKSKMEQRKQQATTQNFYQQKDQNEFNNDFHDQQNDNYNDYNMDQNEHQINNERINNKINNSKQQQIYQCGINLYEEDSSPNKNKQKSNLPPRNDLQLRKAQSAYSQNRQNSTSQQQNEKSKQLQQSEQYSPNEKPQQQRNNSLNRTKKSEIPSNKEHNAKIKNVRGSGYGINLKKKTEQQPSTLDDHRPIIPNKMGDKIYTQLQEDERPIRPSQNKNTYSEQDPINQKQKYGTLNKKPLEQQNNASNNEKQGNGYLPRASSTRFGSSYENHKKNNETTQKPLKQSSDSNRVNNLKQDINKQKNQNIMKQSSSNEYNQDLSDESPIQYNENYTRNSYKQQQQQHNGLDSYQKNNKQKNNENQNYKNKEYIQKREEQTFSSQNRQQKQKYDPYDYMENIRDDNDHISNNYDDNIDSQYYQDEEYYQDQQKQNHYGYSQNGKNLKSNNNNTKKVNNDNFNRLKKTENQNQNQKKPDWHEQDNKYNNYQNEDLYENQYSKQQKSKQQINKYDDYQEEEDDYYKKHKNNNNRDSVEQQYSQKNKYEAPKYNKIQQQTEETFDVDDLVAKATGQKELPEEINLERQYKCPEGCGRSYIKRVLEKHTKICKKVFQQQRKKFDSSQQRQLEDMNQLGSGGGNTKISGVSSKQKKPQTNSNLNKQQVSKASNQEINSKQSINAQKKSKWKQQSEAFRAGLKAGKGEQLSQKEQQALDMGGQDTMQQCPSCGRKFNETAAKRHIPSCAQRMKMENIKKGNAAAAKKIQKF